MSGRNSILYYLLTVLFGVHLIGWMIAGTITRSMGTGFAWECYLIAWLIEEEGRMSEMVVMVISAGVYIIILVLWVILVLAARKIARVLQDLNDTLSDIAEALEKNKTKEGDSADDV